MTPFFISVPVFLIIAAGWLFKKYKIADEIWIHILNRFAYYVSLPALIIASFWNINFSDRYSLMTAAWSASFIVAFMILVVIVLSLFNLPHKTKAVAFLIICTGNTVYMGFPIIINAFGNGSLSMGSLVAVLYLILPILASIFMIRIWANSRRSFSSQVVEFLKNPLTISAVAGVVISFIPKQIVGLELIYKALALLGATASPVALFALGSFLYKRFLRKNFGLVFWSSFAKVAIFPVLAFIAGKIFGIAGPDLGLLTLLAAMPSAVTTFVIAEKFSLDEGVAGNAILISTILSFFAIPLVALII
jgi:predicted permease